MTYCVAVRVDQGLVMLSDTRTNAGMDNIARFRKSFTYSVPGERAIGQPVDHARRQDDAGSSDQGGTA